jgi:replicative DNA helicase
MTTHTTRRQFLTRGFARAVTRPGPRLRLPPSDLQAEQRLVGACLNHPQIRKWALGFVRPDQFADYVHGDILAALRDGGSARAVKSLDEVGGPAYLSQLSSWAREDAELYIGYIIDDIASIISTHGLRELES